MLSLRREMLPLSVVAAGWLFAAFAYGEAPARVPSHWGIDGRPDAWSDRSFLFFPPALMVGLYLLMTLLPRLDREKGWPLLRGTPYLVLRSGVLLVVLATEVLTSFHPSPRAMQLSTGALFVFTLALAIATMRAHARNQARPGPPRDP